MALFEALHGGPELDFADAEPPTTVMWHRYFMNGLAAAQYLTYLLVGALYFLVFGAMAGVTVRASLVGLGAVFVPLLLGGYASALSFIVPRVAALVAFACSVPYLLLGILGIRVTVQTNSFFVIPSAMGHWHFNRRFPLE